MKEGIIDNYNRLPLGKYLEIVEISETVDDELQRQVAILAILSGCSEQEILELPLDEYKERVVASRFLGSEDPNSHAVGGSYRYGDYTLIPTLDPARISTAQYVDFQALCRDEKKLVELVSVFLVPKGCVYGRRETEDRGYDLADVQRVIRESMTVTDALSLAAFFLTALSGSITNSLTYSAKVVRKAMRKEKNPARKERWAKIREKILSLQGGDGLTM